MARRAGRQVVQVWTEKAKEGRQGRSSLECQGVKTVNVISDLDLQGEVSEKPLLTFGRSDEPTGDSLEVTDQVVGGLWVSERLGLLHLLLSILSFTPSALLVML